MSKVRDRILERLRSGGDNTTLPSPPVYRPSYGWSREEKIQRFRTQLQLVRGQVHLLPRNQLPELLPGLLRENNISRLLVSHKVTQLLSASPTDVEYRYYENDIEHWKPELFANVDAGLTTTLGAIAETGSLVLWPDSDEPRLMSLVPPVHIALVNAEEIYETFAQVVADQNWKHQMPTNALLISGPSKTADIEQTLSYGIHGPKQLIVLILH